MVGSSPPASAAKRRSFAALNLPDEGVNTVDGAVNTSRSLVHGRMVAAGVAPDQDQSGTAAGITTALVSGPLLRGAAVLLRTVLTKAASPTDASLGTIGVMISARFNPFEGDGSTVATASNFTVKNAAMPPAQQCSLPEYRRAPVGSGRGTDDGTGFFVSSLGGLSAPTGLTTPWTLTGFADEVGFELGEQIAWSDHTWNTCT